MVKLDSFVIIGFEVEDRLKLLKVGDVTIVVLNAEPGTSGAAAFVKIHGLHSAVNKLNDVEVNLIGSGSGKIS